MWFLGGIVVGGNFVRRSFDIVVVEATYLFEIFVKKGGIRIMDIETRLQHANAST